METNNLSLIVANGIVGSNLCDRRSAATGDSGEIQTVLIHSLVSGACGWQIAAVVLDRVIGTALRKAKVAGRIACSQYLVDS